ncbi:MULTISPECIES: pantoate--beta-alanine ligase [unclassified Ruegeria]|uniref:pantoate--beta-alanine ligase n=1 Tax=unclassified Ruegeria TaxID=2625375 RepID=UPI001492D911|nr:MULTISPECIES: pantoate--beta-alanine ligase [unclassified Ruegeria]NOD33188.1 pantoate--beta-alanine ligase [Ruegeria sp. HKCCD7296]NOE41584.1 pantoate--beta-alanine ligase [Ruegeria sp. HKCCD7319]
MTAPILRSLAELRTKTTEWHRDDEMIGVVPTMGALHEGHLSLAQAAKEGCDRVIVTIFVNPKQFNKPEDLANYPRTEHEDAKKLAPYEVDAIYVPDPQEVYPEGFSTTVSVSGLTDMMEGPFRPGHFEGVATVVAKLFLQTQADRAYFGEKDYQQLLVVRRMARDLDIPVEVFGCPTVREPSGLAMSSRNLLLSSDGLKIAEHMHKVMRQVAQNLAEGGDFATLAQDAKARLLAAGFSEVEYIDLRCAETLESLPNANRPARLFVTAWADGVRLIDNIPVDSA